MNNITFSSFFIKDLINKSREYLFNISLLNGFKENFIRTASNLLSSSFYISFKQTLFKPEQLISVMLLTMLFASTACSISTSTESSSKTNFPAIQPTTSDTSYNSNKNKSQNNSASTAVSCSPSTFTNAIVTNVIDGDTAKIKIENSIYKVRFIGVNSPESTTKIEPYGKEASKFTKSQLEGKTVYLEKDVSETDKYGRLLRYIWLSLPEDAGNFENEIRTKQFNAILVLNGYAQAATYPPDVKYAEYFVKFTAEAREKNVGLWSIK